MFAHYLLFSHSQIDRVTLCLPRSFDDARSEAIAVECAVALRAYGDVATRQLAAELSLDAGVVRSDLDSVGARARAFGAASGAGAAAAKDAPGAAAAAAAAHGASDATDEAALIEHFTLHAHLVRSMTSTEAVTPGATTARTFANALTASLPDRPSSRGCVSATLGVQDLVLVLDALSLFVPAKGDGGGGGGGAGGEATTMSTSRDEASSYLEDTLEETETEISRDEGMSELGSDMLAPMETAEAAKQRIAEDKAHAKEKEHAAAAKKRKITGITSALARLMQREALALTVAVPLLQLTFVNDAVGGQVSCLLCAVTFYANLAHSLTRSPEHL